MSNLTDACYVVTVHTTDDDIRPLVMSGNEIQDTYPHWGGKTEFQSREGFRVTITPVHPKGRD